MLTTTLQVLYILLCINRGMKFANVDTPLSLNKKRLFWSYLMHGESFGLLIEF